MSVLKKPFLTKSKKDKALYETGERENMPTLIPHLKTTTQENVNSKYQKTPEHHTTQLPTITLFMHEYQFNKYTPLKDTQCMMYLNPPFRKLPDIS